MALRESTKAAILQVLQLYKGRYVQVPIVLTELRALELYLTRQTVARYLVGCSCEAIGGGLYRVPVDLPTATQREQPKQNKRRKGDVTLTPPAQASGEQRQS